MLLKKLKELRQSRGLTQANMAKLLKCTERHYQRIESGYTDLPISKVVCLANYFGVSIDYLVGHPDD